MPELRSELSTREIEEQAELADEMLNEILAEERAADHGAKA
jgi:hypothetical protein